VRLDHLLSREINSAGKYPHLSVVQEETGARD